jgi:hypothetical protein
MFKATQKEPQVIKKGILCVDVKIIKGSQDSLTPVSI